MARLCSVCTHRERSALDASLLENESTRSVAKQHGLSPSAVLRHRNGCMGKALASAKQAGEAASAENIVGKASQLLTRIERVLTEAEETRDVKTILSASREAVGLLRLLGELHGRLGQAGSVAIQVNVDARQQVREAFDLDTMSPGQLDQLEREAQAALALVADRRRTLRPVLASVEVLQ